VRKVLLALLTSMIMFLLSSGQVLAQPRDFSVPRGPTVSDVDKHITDLKSSSSLSEVERAGVMKIYREARALLQQAEARITQTRQMREREQSAPQMVVDMQRRLNEPRATRIATSCRLV